MLHWDFWLVGDEDEDLSLVRLAFPFATYLTLYGSLAPDSRSYQEAWRYLLASVKTITDASAAGDLPDGEWGTFHHADR